jgi:N-acetylmuramoyl-L-alanine amidase
VSPPVWAGRLALWLLVWVSLAPSAWGQTAAIVEVEVLAGHRHARVVVVTKGTPTELVATASPPVGAVPARGVLRLSGASVGSGGERTIPVAKNGVLRVQLLTVGDDVRLSVDLTEARTVRARALEKGVIVFDLIEADASPDPAIPDDASIRAWSKERDTGLAFESSTQGRQYLVVIDAGHGGHDYGAVGHSGIREADIALQIALRIAALLEAHPSIDILMTRDADDFVKLRDRARIANEAGADLFLSIHANSTEARHAELLWGVETYSLDIASDGGAQRVAARENKVAKEFKESQGSTDRLRASLEVAGTNRLSAQLAGAVQTQVIDRLTLEYDPQQVNDLGAKTALFYVLTTTRMPAILFEAGFLSHPDDERRLRSPYYQQVVAEALVSAVEKWLVSQ